MNIDDIRITRGATLTASGRTRYTLDIESNGYHFSGSFDDLLGFFTAVSDSIKYFGQAHGLLRRDKHGVYSNPTKR